MSALGRLRETDNMPRSTQNFDRSHGPFLLAVEARLRAEGVQPSSWV